jgi:hypothetical protein
MGTRGAWGYIKNDEMKVTYNHFDSYPEGLGQRVLDFCNTKTVSELNEIYEKMRIVEEDDAPTINDIELCKKHYLVDLGVSRQSVDDWYCLLRKAQGDPQKYADVGIMTDGSNFLKDSLFCEYAYLINLDSNMLEIYEGFQKSQPKGRFSDVEKTETEYYPVSLIMEFSLLNLPENLNCLTETAIPTIIIDEEANK